MTDELSDDVKKKLILALTIELQNRKEIKSVLYRPRLPYVMLLYQYQNDSLWRSMPMFLIKWKFVIFNGNLLSDVFSLIFDFSFFCQAYLAVTVMVCQHLGFTTGIIATLVVTHCLLVICKANQGKNMTCDHTTGCVKMECEASEKCIQISARTFIFDSFPKGTTGEQVNEAIFKQQIILSNCSYRS